MTPRKRYAAMTTRTRQAWLALLLWYLPALFVQVTSAWVTFDGLDPWYRELVKAPWNPPDWLFGPVWTLLYAMMTIAVWQVSLTQTAHAKRITAYRLYFFQLGLNGLWSQVFFGMQQPGWSLLNLAALLVVAALTARTFARIKPFAGWLLSPYLVWLAYALSLNAAIWWWN